MPLREKMPRLLCSCWRIIPRFRLDQEPYSSTANQTLVPSWTRMQVMTDIFPGLNLLLVWRYLRREKPGTIDCHRCGRANDTGVCAAHVGQAGGSHVAPD